MHERIQEQIQQQIEKYYEKLPKTLEKQEEWQLHKVDFYTTASTNSVALFDDSHRWMFDPGGGAYCQSKRLLSEIDLVDLRIDFLKKEEMMDTIQPHTSLY